MPGPFSNYDLSLLELDGILLETGWGKYRDDPQKYFGSSRPSIPEFVVDKVLEKSLRFFGCDLPSVDKSGTAEKIVHTGFLTRDVVLYENLTNLERLPEAVAFTFIGLPLNFQGVDGSPVRAVAILEGGGF